VLPLKRISSLLFFMTLGVTFLQAVALNTPAPKFTLLDLHHHKRSLSDYKGKVVVIDFWASWCGPCQVELPELNRLAGEYQSKKVIILAVNVDEDRTAAQKTLARLGPGASHLQVLWDTLSKTVSIYNIDSMPTSYILDQRGIIRFTHAGFHSHDPAIWRQEIDSLLSS